MERWLSWSKALAWRASKQQPCFVGSNPTLSAIFCGGRAELELYEEIIGRTRRGVSGALYPQSAIAGSKACLRPFCFGVRLWLTVLITGSRATGVYEPRQDREVAAVSRCPCVPRGCLVGAGCLSNAWGSRSKQVCGHLFVRRVWFWVGCTNHTDRIIGFKLLLGWFYDLSFSVSEVQA